VDNEKGRPGLSIVPGGGGIFCSFAILLFCISQWEGGTDVRLGGSNSPETTAWGAFFFIVIFFFRILSLFSSILCFIGKKGKISTYHLLLVVCLYDFLLCGERKRWKSG
jgi:hypothetical protein